MGEDTPPTDPALDPDLWYCVHVDFYQDASGKQDCTQDYGGDIKCCRKGWQIQNWLDGPWECVRGQELCTATGFTAQKLLDVTGGWDILQDCVDICFV